MYTGIYTLLHIPIGVGVFMVYYSILKTLLQPKYTRKRFLTLVSLLYSIVATYLVFPLSPAQRFVCNTALYLALPFALFRGKTTTKLLAFFLWMLLFPCAEVLAMLAAPLWGWHYNDFSPLNQLVFDTVCTMIAWALSVTFISIKRVVDEKPEPQLMRRLCFVGAALVACTFLLIFNAMHWALDTVHPLISQSLNILNAICAFLPFLVMNRIIDLLEQLNTSMQESEKYRLMESRAMTELRQTRALAAKDEMFRSLRHDFQNHLLALDTLAHQGETERLHAYIAELLTVALSTGIKSYCGHPVIDGLLQTKAQRMKESGIEAKWRTKPVPGNIPLSDLELCCLIGNALDNAIESCERLPQKKERHISVSLDISERGFFFQVVNSCADAQDVVRHMSTRSQKRLRGPGLGLKSMQRVVDTHGGEMLHTADTPGSISLHIYIPA